MKKIAAAIISVGLLLALAGCAWKVPEKVSVKSNADYSFSLGTYENELGNDMDMASMLGSSTNTNVAKYDYFPGRIDKNTQHYLLTVKVLDATLVAENAIDSTYGSNDTMTLGTNIATTAITTSATIQTGFNPSTIIGSIADALGSNVNGKISFNYVPVYLYCEKTSGITATIDTISLYYATAQDASSTEIITDCELNATANYPVPEFPAESGSLVISNLGTTNYIGNAPEDIKDLLNYNVDHPDATIDSTDQMCIHYELSGVGGTVTKAAAQASHGVKFTIYAVIDLPLRFDVLDDLPLNFNSMSGDDSNSSSSSDNSDSSISKYLDIVEAVSIKYIAYKLPLFATSGMELGVKIGSGEPTYSRLTVVDKNKTITERDKGVIELPYTSVLAMKQNGEFKPDISIRLRRNSIFSIPREKNVEMNIELTMTTDGVVQIK